MKCISNVVLLPYWELFFRCVSPSVSLIRAIDYSFVPVPTHRGVRKPVFIRSARHFASEFISSSRIVHFTDTIFILPVTLQTFTSHRKQIIPCHMYGHLPPAERNKKLLTYLPTTLVSAYIYVRTYFTLKLCFSGSCYTVLNSKTIRRPMVP